MTSPIPDRETDGELVALQKIFIENGGLHDGKTLESTSAITDKNYEKRLAAFIERIEKLEELHPLKDDNKEIVEYLSRFIKRNKKLLHLNLDSTQLNEWMLFKLSISLRRSTSCVSFHASGNPGMTPEFKELIWRRLRCKDPHQKYHKIDYDRDQKCVMASSGGRGRKIKENLEVRAHAQRKLDDVSMGIEINENKLVFTRQLGHKIDIPMAGQWKMVDDTEKCWICENHVYTLFFWSRKTGNIANTECDDV